MSLLHQILGVIGSLSGSSAASSQPLQTVLHSLLSENGGLQGLMDKCTQNGLGEVFASWVGTGENQSITAEQVMGLLGSEQIRSLASHLGLDPAQASSTLANYLPMIVDKLTPGGQLSAHADLSGGIASLLPSLLASLTRGSDQA